MGEPLVSIFIQVYNTAPYLRRCLESVLALRGPWEREILVIDDASQDGSDKILEKYQKRMRIVRHKTNAGANATANEGYAACRGKYVIRLDSDDALRPNCLNEMIPLIENNIDVGLVYGDVVLINENDQISSEKNIVRRNGRPVIGDEFFDLCMENYIFAPTTLVKQEALEKLLPIPSEYSFLDWYITTGIAHNWKTAFCKSVVAEYRLHSENAHEKMIKDKSGEAITFLILNALWASSHRQKEKILKRKKVFGKNYLIYADKYYIADMFLEALSCYIKGFFYSPSLLFKNGAWRRAVCSLVFPKSVKRIKKYLLNRKQIKKPKDLALKYFS